jgi:RimJ/RimL family protein N-acetyltransferase
MITRIRRAVTRHGFRGLCAAALARLVGYIYVDEEHIWYEMPLVNGDRTRHELAQGLVLEQVPAEHVEARLAAIAPLTARERNRLATEGARLWLVSEGQRPAFACCIFPRRAPVSAAPHGWYEMPPGTVCLEGSVTAPEYRGQSIAPAALTGIADRLADGGCERIVTKVTVENAPARRAVDKLGFHEIGHTVFSRRGPRRRVEIRNATPFGRELLAGLGRGATLHVEELARQ